MANVSIQHVSKQYADGKGSPARAVEDFSLEVENREFVAIVGPSGCGKSTTLRMIAGLEETSQGEILIGGKRMNGVPAQDRDIAMVFQSCALYPHMSVYDNMAFGLKLRKVAQAEIKRRVEDAANLLGIAELLERRPRALSGGQRQRVALGRAIVAQPKVFLFDEPLSNLDPAMRAQLRAEIIKLHQRLQATMIYVTHDQAEAMTMGDRIVVMKEGVIQQADAPLKVYREPENLFVAGFLGSPPMNLIHGKLREAGGEIAFKEAPGGVLDLKLASHAWAKAWAGREVILGLRPEAITLVSGRQEPGVRFPALVDFVEPLGPETNVSLQTGAHALACRTAAPMSHEDAGHRALFEIDSAQAHLFDPETGRRLVA